MPLKLMTLEEAVAAYDHALDEYIQESYWTREWSSNNALDLLSQWSRKDGFVLCEIDHYDEILHNAYECTEKGLS